MKVLIADDNAASCKLLRAVLETEGHAVIVAADGYEVLGLLERHPVDASRRRGHRPSAHRPVGYRS